MNGKRKRCPNGYRIVRWADGFFHLYGPDGGCIDEFVSHSEALRVAMREHGLTRAGADAPRAPESSRTRQPMRRAARAGIEQDSPADAPRRARRNRAGLASRCAAGFGARLSLDDRVFREVTTCNELPSCQI